MPIVGVLLVVGLGDVDARIGLLLRFGQSAEILAWGTTSLILALSGVFNPVEAIPGRCSRSPDPAHHLRVRAPPATVLDGEPDALGRPRPGPPSGRCVLAVLSMVFVLRMLASSSAGGYVTRYS